MSILSGIKNFIYQTIGVDDTKSAKTKSVKSTKSASTKSVKSDPAKTSEPVFQQNPSPVGDVVTIKNKESNKKQTTAQPQRSVGQIRQSIENKCRANNLDFTKLKQRFGYIAEDLKTKFEELPEKEQVKILLVVEHEIDRIIQLQNKHGKSVQTDTTNAVIESAKTKVEAEEVGIKEKDLEKDTDDVKNKLGKDFSKVSINERRRRLDAYAKSEYKKFREQLDVELAKLPESERAAYEEKMIKEYDIKMQARFNDIIATQDSETGLNAIVILRADKMAEGMRIVKRTRANRAEVVRISDKADWNFTEGIIQTQYDRGERISCDAVQEYTTEVITDKSATAVQQYQTRYMERRQAFENGENVPEYLNQDFFTASAKGIGQGALNNTNMTMDEKAEFISQWKEDAQKFEDRDVVTKDVNEILEKNPEYKKLAEKVQVIEAKKAAEKAVQKDTNKTQTTTTKVIENKKQTSVTTETVAKPQVVNSQKEEKVKPAKQVTSNTVTNPLTQNNQEIAKDIQALGIDNAIKEYGHKAVIFTVLDNQNLKHMRPTLAPIIKSYDLQSLKKLVSDCSTGSFLYICSIVNKEYVAELRDERQDLCYSARKIVENMEKQNA